MNVAKLSVKGSVRMRIASNPRSAKGTTCAIIVFYIARHSSRRSISK